MLKKNKHDGDEFRKLLKSNDLTQEEFSRKINVTRQTVYRWTKEGEFPRTRWTIINEVLQKDKNNYYISEPVKELPLSSIKMIPVVNRLAYASYTQQWDDNNYIETLQKLPAFMPENGIFRWFEISNDSMTCENDNSINDGDYVLAKKLHQDYWRDKLHLNRFKEWIIIHKKHGIMIKEIANQDLTTGDIVCRSYNPHEKDFTLNLDDIQELYYVKIVQKKR